MSSRASIVRKLSSARSIWFWLGIMLLIAIYIFQRFDFLGLFLSLVSVDADAVHPYTFFIFNKTFRFVGNDLACLMIIYFFFSDRKYRVLAWFFFLAELLVILPAYFVLKLSIEGDSEISSPLLSQIHRIIVNPMLMLLLMVAFFYQNTQARRGHV